MSRPLDTLRTVVDQLTSPPWLFSLALAIFLSCRSSQRIWTRAGGIGMLTLAAALLGLGLSDPTFRRLLLHPERLPVVVLLLSTLASLWLEMHRWRSRGAGGEPAAAREPGLAAADLVAVTAVGLALTLCAGLLPPSLGGEADPASRPALVKAPWFLVGLQEVRHFFDPWFAYGALPALYLAGLLGLPYLEPARRSVDPRVRALFLFAWLFLWLWPIVAGAVLRGPHWTAFGPFESWDASRPAAPEPPALSASFWIHGLGMLEPARWWIRELPGMLLLGVYFILLPRFLARWSMTRSVLETYRAALGGRVYRVAAVWILAVLLVPLKMYGRWLLGIGYWIHLPELSLRF